MKTPVQSLNSTGYQSISSNTLAPTAIFEARKAITIQSATSKWFIGLNSLRFVLAFIVLLSHLPNPSVNALKHSKVNIFRYTGMGLGVTFCGVAAVMAFFIISGFVIHYPNKKGIKNIKNFYTRRLIRVLIPLIVIKLLGLFFGSPENSVIWSLYCELIFYVIYPFLIRIKLTWKTKLLVSYVFSAIIISTVGSHDIASMFTQSNQGWVGEFYHLGVGFTWLIGLPSWLLGVNLAQKIDDLTETISVQKILLYRGIIIILAISSSIVRFHAFTSYTLTMTILSVPMAIWLEAEILYYKNATPIRFFENSGKFSYSLYLCHPLIIAFLLHTIALTPYTYFLYLLACVGGAYGFYLLLEKPSHLLAEKLTRPVKAA